MQHDSYQPQIPRQGGKQEDRKRMHLKRRHEFCRFARGEEKKKKKKKKRKKGLLECDLPGRSTNNGQRKGYGAPSRAV